jgi:hypothetical protein
MSKGTWVHWLLASILILVMGAVVLVAEERIEVKVEKHGADEITVDVNGEAETIRLEDLADGEERSFDVGDHSIVVKRAGEDLTVTTDGGPLGSLGGHGTSLDTMVWVSDDGEEIEIDADCEHTITKKLIVMSAGSGDEGEAKTYTIHLDGNEVLLDEEMNIEIDEIMELAEGGHPPHGAIFISKDGHGLGEHHFIHKGGDLAENLVVYRCEESGSMLMLNKDDAVEDTYLCPATGCVMSRVEGPQTKVIKIRKTIEVDEEKND